MTPLHPTTTPSLIIFPITASHTRCFIPLLISVFSETTRLQVIFQSLHPKFDVLFFLRSKFQLIQTTNEVIFFKALTNTNMHTHTHTDRMRSDNIPQLSELIKSSLTARLPSIHKAWLTVHIYKV